MLRRWRWPMIILLAGIALAAAYASLRLWLLAAGLVVLAAAYAYRLSPLPFPRAVTAAQAQAAGARDGRPIIYWRPGCAYCLRLRRRLGADAARAHWVDIWRDPQGAAAVRAVTGGDETVPTAVIDGVAVVNPDPAAVLAALRRETGGGSGKGS